MDDEIKKEKEQLVDDFHRAIKDTNSEYREVESIYGKLASIIMASDNPSWILEQSKYAKELTDYVKKRYGENSDESVRAYALIVSTNIITGNFKKAQSAFDKINKINAKKDEPYDLEDFLRSLPDIFDSRMPHVSIDEISKEIRSIREKNGIESEEYINSVDDIISELIDAGMSPEALVLVERELEVLNSQPVSNQTKAMFYQYASFLYSDVDDFEEALNCLERIIELGEADNINHLEYVQFLIMLHREQEALEYGEKILSEIEDEDLFSCELRDNMAFCYSRLCQMDKAIAMQEENLDVAEVIFDPASIEILNTKIDLAQLYLEADRFQDSVNLLEDEVSEYFFDSDANIFDLIEEEEAEDYDLDALQEALDERILAHRKMAGVLIDGYINQGNTKKCRKYIRLLKSSLKNTDDDKFAESLNIIYFREATCLRIEGKLEQALKKINSTLKKTEKLFIYNENKPVMIEMRLERARILRDLNMIKEAIEEYSFVLENALRAFGSEDRIVNIVYKELEELSKDE